MPSDYVICVREVARGKFIAEPGATLYLELPEAAPDQTSADPLSPKQAIKREDWFRKVMAEAMRGTNPGDATEFGDVLVFIHGFNNNQSVVMQRHRQLKQDLRAIGYEGAVVSFDWPSDDKTLNYIEDRSNAKTTALALVDDAITAFARYQQDNCRISTHLLGHSTGAYVIREAFDDADDRKALAARNWMASQIMLIGGDVSAGSMSEGNAGAESIYRHCVRLTNYSNPFDSVLKLSNVKRLGLAPRVGRVGLPDDAPSTAVNVDCGDYFQTLNEKNATFYGTFCHSWHIGDKTFAADLLETIYGDAGRDQIKTRQIKASGGLKLVPAS
jgi:pimeloyl-ACP methyl ester carboxylesterase